MFKIFTVCFCLLMWAYTCLYCVHDKAAHITSDQCVFRLPVFLWACFFVAEQTLMPLWVLPVQPGIAVRSLALCLGIKSTLFLALPLIAGMGEGDQANQDISDHCGCPHLGSEDARRPSFPPVQREPEELFHRLAPYVTRFTQRNGWAAVISFRPKYSYGFTEGMTEQW